MVGKFENKLNIFFFIAEVHLLRRLRKTLTNIFRWRYAHMHTTYSKFDRTHHMIISNIYWQTLHACLERENFYPCPWYIFRKWSSVGSGILLLYMHVTNPLRNQMDIQNISKCLVGIFNLNTTSTITFHAGFYGET